MAMTGLRPAAVHHAGLVVSDLDAAVAWFDRHLGLRPASEWMSGEMRIVLVAGGADGAVRLELFGRPGAAPGPDEALALGEHFGRRGWKHAAFTVADLAATVEAMRADGVSILHEPSDAPAGFRWAFVRGPDGVPIELVEERED